MFETSQYVFDIPEIWPWMPAFVSNKGLINVISVKDWIFCWNKFGFVIPTVSLFDLTVVN